jgi:hypothetical protein
MCFHMFCLNSMIAKYINIHEKQLLFNIHVYLNKTKTSKCKELSPIMCYSIRMYAEAKVEISDARRCRIFQFGLSRF